MNTTNFLMDSTLAGTTSLMTGIAIHPDPTQPSVTTTIVIPLITGLLAPLIKEIIITLRENRKRKREEKENKKG